MPELPEVETLAGKLRPSLVGRTLTSVEVLWARTIDRPALPAFRQAMVGARVVAVGRRGKFLRFDLDTGRTLLVHLRMSGRFVVHPPEANPAAHKHARVRLWLDDGTELTYIDPRKFGRFYLVEDPQEVVGHLGPEPLSPTFTPAWLAEHLAGRRGEIKRLLLDQRFLVGLGNIYVNEALWRACIHPRRTAGELTVDEVRRLHDAIVTVLRRGLAHGGTSLDDRQYVYPDGRLGRHQRYLQVYDRAEEACPRCGCSVERIRQGQRSTYYCPACQPPTDEG